MRFIAMLLAGSVLAAMPAHAQTEDSADVPTRTGDAELGASEEIHEEADAQIVVRAPFITDFNILTGTSTLSGTELIDSIRPQIGDTLTKLPGVSATSFGPGASRPVLRGFSGTRVRVLTDGIGSIDVSNTSADHAVTIDPLTAERIEVLRGPAALLYGSQAIGGAVNVIDRRIPRRIPDEAVHTEVTGVYGSAANELSIGGAVDVPLGGGFVAHADGSYRDSDDLEVGGFVLSRRLRAELAADAAEEREEGHLDEAAELEEFINLRGVLPNSATQAETAGFGVSLIRNQNAFGASVSHYGTEYGIATRPGAGHGHEEEEGGETGEEHGEAPVTIGLNQFRFDSRGVVAINGHAIDAVRFRFGFADYEHTEFEGDEVGTVFGSQGMEFRLELQTVDWNGWSIAYGGQFLARDFTAVGAEAFVPPNTTEEYGLFAFVEHVDDALTIQAATRVDFSGVDADSVGFDRQFTSLSGAIGATYELESGIQFGANLSRAERSPAAEELYSNGPHIATQAFEIGDPDLTTEKSIGLEGFVRGRIGPVNFGVTAYANWFDDYIFDTATGLEEDGLPIFQYFQTGARYYGFELEAAANLFEVGPYQIRFEGLADHVRATLDDSGGPVPRIPPLRFLGGLEARSEALHGRVEVEWTDDQGRVATFETPTDSFTLVNASLSWRPPWFERGTAIVASVNNLFDVDARRHASFTKDFVPLAGRDLRLSARLSF